MPSSGLEGRLNGSQVQKGCKFSKMGKKEGGDFNKPHNFSQSTQVREKSLSLCWKVGSRMKRERVAEIWRIFYKVKAFSSGECSTWKKKKTNY